MKTANGIIRRIRKIANLTPRNLTSNGKRGAFPPHAAINARIVATDYVTKN